MNKKWLFLFFCVLLVVGCKKKNLKNPQDYYKGELTVLTDDSFKSVVTALGDAYMAAYPESRINVKTMKEDFGFLELLHKKAKLVVMSRELNKDEIEAYKKVTKLDFNPAKFAADAVVFVVPVNSSLTSISVDQIKQGLASDSKPFIFDGTNSGNLNFIAQKLNKKPADLKFNIISGNENVIKEIGKYSDKIGVVSLNTISRPYGKEAEELRKMVKVLPIISNGKSYNPMDTQSLRTLQYPFTRIVYFLVNEPGFQLANGFMRYSCTQIGQMVVEKEGLQPFNIYKREVQMH